MSALRHEFEGEQLTLREIRARVPILGERTIAKRLALGLTTRIAMLSYDEAAEKRRAGVRGRAAAEAAGLGRSIERGGRSRTQAARSGFQPRPTTQGTTS